MSRVPGSNRRSALSHRLAFGRRRLSGALFSAAVVMAAFGMGGCLQDAYNADKGFNFNNPADPTQTASNTVAIAAVDYLSSVQSVVIVNSSGSAQDMTGWILLNQNTGNAFTFSTFSLGAGNFVRVHPGAGTNSTLDLYSGSPAPSATSPTWSLNNIAILRNASSANVSACTVGSPVC